MIKIKTKNYNMISIEKLQKCQHYHQEKVDKNEYHTVEEILPSNHCRIIEQADLKYSPLGKAFKKQIKSIEEQEENK